MFLGNGSNKLFNIANVSWKRKLLKATNLVILRLLSIEFQVIIYILSKNFSKFDKTFLKEEAAKGYQPCDPLIIVDRVSFKYFFVIALNLPNWLKLVKTLFIQTCPNLSRLF